MTEEQDYPINELVRVRIGKVEKTMGRALAEQSDDVEILDDAPIRTVDGRMLDETGFDGRPLKPRTSVTTEATAKKAASADEKKEQS